MNVTLAVLSVLAGVTAIGAVYEIEDRHDAASERMRALDRKIENAERDIHVLHAEWSYQTRPARLEELAQRLLPLQPTGPDRIIADPAALQAVIDRLDGVIEARTAEARQ
jgi:hypothetical protein